MFELTKIFKLHLLTTEDRFLKSKIEFQAKDPKFNPLLSHNNLCHQECFFL